MELHVFSIPIPPPTSLSTWSLWVFPVHQAQTLVSCIQPGLVICFTIDNIHVSMLFSRNIPPLPSPTESKSLFCTSVSLFLFLNEISRIQNTNSVNYILPVWKHYFFLRFWAQANLSSYHPTIVFSLTCTISDFHSHPLNLHEILFLFLANYVFAFPVTNTLLTKGLSEPYVTSDVCIVLSTALSGIICLSRQAWLWWPLLTQCTACWICQQSHYL